MTLCGFLNQYKDEISVYKEDSKDKVSILDKYSKLGDAGNLILAIGKFYCYKQRECAAVMPDIYQHRIQRTLGIENSL
jgi:hypothetical protein